MKKNIILIRTTKNSDRLDIIINNFNKYSIFDYCIIEERYVEEDSKTELIKSNHLIVSEDYLKKNNLEKINKTGWQCGDYILYAGNDYFPNYDYYWIIDDDLYLNLDMNQFISKANSLNYDCLGTDFRLATPNWYWHKTLSDKFEKVYGMLFGLVRFSKKSALFLKQKRSEYHPKLKKDQLNSLFSNDESFTATYLANNGFNCKKIQDVFPEYFSKNLFTLSEKPIAVDELELDYTKEQIIHPVCNVARFRNKTKKWIEENNQEKYIPSLYRLYCNLGVENADKYFNIKSGLKLKDFFYSDNLVNLYELSDILNEKKIPNLIKFWFYKEYCYVLDFEINGIKFALDIEANGNIYFVVRNEACKKISKSIFKNSKNRNCFVKECNFTNIYSNNLKLGNKLIDNIIKVLNFIRLKIIFFQLKQKIFFRG